MPRIVSVPSAASFQRRKFGLIGLGVLIVVGGGWALLKWQSLYAGMPRLPDTAQLWSANREPAIEFVDAKGRTLAVRGPRYGRAVRVEDLPEHVVEAFLAAEDKRFYQHDGADEAAIARAVVSNAAAGETVSGASTITQQVIKNFVLDSRQTMQRKAQEISLARELETKMTKDEILSLYLSRIYFGAGLYGIDAASRHYFGKAPAQLEIHEAALLAALPKAPSKLNLRENLDGAKQRQGYVLTEMVNEKFITRDQAAAARAAEIKIIPAPVADPGLGFVLDAATERLGTILPGIPGDLVVTLTIDPDVQKKVEARLAERMAKEGPAAGASQVAALVLDKDGRMVAMVGGTNYAASPFNRATQAKRQPGSSFKPFVYAAAFESQYSPYDVFVDRPIAIDKWKPTNYDGTFLGPMTLSEALTRSTNTVAAELGQAAGMDRVVSLAQRFGITSDMKAFPSTALGSQEVTLWEITRAYGAFQSGGLRLDPYMIESIGNSRGDVLFAREDTKRERVYSPDFAAEMNAVMTRVVNAAHGTGAKAKIKGWTVAGKTGTSQDWRDAWFIGFTSAYTGGVWVGNDDDSPMRKVTGGGLPSDLWSDVMAIVHEGQTPRPLFGADSGLVLDPAAEARITFYRGMAQAFGVAANQRTASYGGDGPMQDR